MDGIRLSLAKVARFARLTAHDSIDSARSIYRKFIPLEWRLHFRYFRHPYENPSASIVAYSSRLESSAYKPPASSHESPSSDRSWSHRSTTTAAHHHSYDVFIFSIIDFEARFQRPQQLAVHLARAGHRVFYVSCTKFLPPTDRRPYQIHELGVNVFEVQLKASHVPDIYSKIAPMPLQWQLLSSLSALQFELDVFSAISVVHLPFWSPVALHLRAAFGWRVIYDCMDEWGDFPLIGADFLAEEKVLVPQADVVSVTAGRLYDKWSEQAQKCILVRNAVDFDFFQSNLGPSTVLQGTARPIIGYYGAIAEWLDLDLIRAIAVQRPTWQFVMLGDIFTDVSALERIPNVHLLGRKPYPQMPLYLYQFDVCLIPFRINEVTNSVDPVKFYEYMSAGKPVVSARIDELAIYKDYVFLAQTTEEFITSIEQALAEDHEVEAPRRMDLARRNNWTSRIAVLDKSVVETYSKVSIVIVTYNNLNFTQECLESIYHYTSYPNYEVIVVDNASSDGTPEALVKISEGSTRIRSILNKDNLGFAAANNQGIAASSGDYVILLNNDTQVTVGWIETLIGHLQNPSIGMVGPVTNRCGNEARIAVSYRDEAGMRKFARERTMTQAGKTLEISMLAMFCVALRRSVIDDVGPLDEQFGIGMFEDDDYALRVQNKGLRTVCAEDVFIHHEGQASFKSLIENNRYNALWSTNQAYFEKKWARKWEKPKMRKEFE